MRTPIRHHHSLSAFTGPELHLIERDNTVGLLSAARPRTNRSYTGENPPQKRGTAVTWKRTRSVRCKVS